ncbi:microsomal signal peptidase subunit spcs1 domain-containing protein [Cyclospora cayetanensis]|uniref:Signal peptidase complex subunit 1 n=1 Tax=Cyclospora cayetanensis TaxID=88456 RepID=A0A1D3D8G0_9EIME|nr:microsomal signal peptidase subunit spcs1 domain-containing protein [Cyclospora cayetanensis]
MIQRLRRTVDALKEGVVDFEAQHRLQDFLVHISVAGTLCAFLLGFFTESFYDCFLTVLATTLVAALVCIPSWPIYKRNPINWTPHDPKRIAQLYASDMGVVPPIEVAPEKRPSKKNAAGNKKRK